MDTETEKKPSFEISHEEQPSNSLVIGLSEFGMAGLTAVQFLTDALEMKKTGHIEAEDLPSITPFENGEPRHHTRFYTSKELDFTLLAGELFIPLWASRPFSEEVMEWGTKNNIDDITFLMGLPFPHSPEEHSVFYIATSDYREKRLQGTDINPMGGGYLEGVHADLVSRGIDSPLSVGVLTTPTHPPWQDVDASLRLLNAFQQLFDVEFDVEPLEDYASDLKDYQDQLVQRLEQTEAEDSMKKRDFAEDRTYV